MRVIDYIYRNKVKRFVVRKPIETDENGVEWIRLEWVDYNPNIHMFEWVIFKKEKLVTEYSPEDAEYINILKVWVKFIRILIENNKGVGLGTSHLECFWKKALKYHELKKDFNKIV